MKNLLLLTLLFSFGALAQSVRYEADTDVFAGDGKEHKMVLEVGKEDATSNENAHKVFIPMRDYKVQDGSNTASNTDFTILSPSDSIPWFNLAEPFNNSAVRQTLRVTSTVHDLYLYAALLGTDRARLDVINPGSPVKISSNSGVVTLNYYVKIHDLCAIADSGCTPLTYDSEDIQRLVVEPIVYFFLSREETYPNPTNLQLGDFPEGTFFKYALSNSVDLADDLAVLDNLIKGDGRLKATYSGQKITEMKDVVGILYSSPPAATFTVGEYPQQSFADAIASGGKLWSVDNGTGIPGEIFIKNLTNYEEYWVGVAFVNKWSFATLISETQSQIPERIEAFLEAKACYLLSAGFREDHYVLDYFRNFRDKFLVKSVWGKRFIQFYYDTAPKYAQIIWQNETLAKIVRFFAFMAYFLMRYFPAIALLIFTGLILRKVLRWHFYQ